MNPSASRILGVNSQDCIGKHATELSSDIKPTVLEVLRTKRGFVDKEVRFETKRGKIHIIKTAIPLCDDNGEIMGVVDIFNEIKRVKNMVNQLTGARAAYTVSDIIGECPEMMKVKNMVRQASLNESTVLIQGESGTGKDIIAQAIHNYGGRRDKPFVAVNCGALPRQLIESELFGYEEGSFTGAVKGGRPGKFEMAHEGTIFLDEIGDMPYEMQAELLRVLQNKSIVRVGGNTEISVDVKIIAATNRNIWKLVQEKSFREDLFYRLNVIDIRVPPLRERGDDLMLFIKHFIETDYKVTGINRELSPEVLDVLENWYWPGNVRELQHAIEHAVWLAGEERIRTEHLPRAILEKGRSQKRKAEIMSLKDYEALAIKSALEQTNSNLSETAKTLGIARNTLYEKMKKLGIEKQASVR
jgi:transcriptional regulator with PAS, ATPase and Fis domain